MGDERRPTARWFEDPLGGHRWRYWDGDQWTAWVADAGAAFRDPVAGAESFVGLAPPRVEFGNQRFLCETFAIGAPIFVFTLGFLALAALTHGARGVGLVLSAASLVVAVSSLFQSYTAVVTTDGALTFKALARTISTRVEDVHQISVRSGGRGGGRSYVFHFGGGTASLGEFGGQRLTQFLLQENPAIRAPMGWS